MPLAQEGGEHARGTIPLLVMGGLGASPEKFFNFGASMCVLNGILCVWDQILVVLVTKIFLVA